MNDRRELNAQIIQALKDAVLFSGYTCTMFIPKWKELICKLEKENEQLFAEDQKSTESMKQMYEKMENQFKETGGVISSNACGVPE